MVFFRAVNVFYLHFMLIIIIYIYLLIVIFKHSESLFLSNQLLLDLRAGAGLLGTSFN